MPENRPETEKEKNVKFRKGQSGNPGGRPKVMVEVQQLARQHAPAAIVELARLALKAKNETARIAAIRELLDRGYGRPRQSMEVSVPAGDHVLGVSSGRLFCICAGPSRGSPPPPVPPGTSPRAAA